MSIIEQAERRLEQLRRSGIELPGALGSTEAAPAEAKGKGLPAMAVHVAEEGRNLRPGRPPAPRVEQPAGAPPGALTSKQVVIDLARLARAGYVTPEAPRSQISEEFRVVKRPLLINLEGKTSPVVENASCIMVTSSLPGEGKTFVAINLAISLAMELDTSVLLVDADVSRPSILSRLGVAPSPGLLDVLADAAVNLNDVLLRTNVERLSILPAGAPRGRATELLASDAMNRLLDEMATRYADRIIVFDAPPLLPSTESRVLASRMGQIVFVVEAETTPQKSVSRALATIETCPVVMPLLNKVSRSEVGFYYGYYGPVEG